MSGSNASRSYLPHRILCVRKNYLMQRTSRKTFWLGASLAAGAVFASWLYRYVTNNDKVEGDENAPPSPELAEENCDVTQPAMTPADQLEAQLQQPARAREEQHQQELAWGAQWCQMYRDAGQSNTPHASSSSQPTSTPGGSWHLPPEPNTPLPTSNPMELRSGQVDPIVLNDYDPDPGHINQQPVQPAKPFNTGFHLPPVPDSVSALRSH